MLAVGDNKFLRMLSSFLFGKILEDLPIARSIPTLAARQNCL